MLRALAAAALLLVAPVAAGAEERSQPIAEVASDLAYGLCPLYLAGELELTSPELSKRGFGAIEKQTHPHYGELTLVSARRSDGELTFGGAAGKTCSVVIMGANRAAALARLRATMPWMGFDFKKTPNLTPDRPGLTVETFKAPVEGQTLYVQLMQGAGPTPAVIAQLFVLEQ